MSNSNPFDILLASLHSFEEGSLESYNSLAAALLFGQFDLCSKSAILSALSQPQGLLHSFQQASKLAYTVATGAMSAHYDQLFLDSSDLRKAMQMVAPAGHLINFLVQALDEADRLKDPQACAIERSAIESLKASSITQAVLIFQEAAMGGNVYQPTPNTLKHITAARYYAHFCKQIPSDTHKILEKVANSLPRNPAMV